MASEMKFICDFMLGKLTRYLRMCGYDTAFVKYIKDDKLLKIAFETNRLVLTRDKKIIERKLIKNGSVELLLISSTDIVDQLKQIKNNFNTIFRVKLIRCIDCNTILLPINKNEIKSDIPIYVYQNHENFLFCQNCKKIYWKGTHVTKMMNFFHEHKLDI